MKTYDIPNKFKKVGFSITKGKVVQLKTIPKNIDVLTLMPDTKTSNERLTIAYYSDGTIYKNGEKIKD